MITEERSTHQLGFIFAAKSTVDLKGSIGTQLSDCRALAEREGIEIVDEFQTENASAYHGNRDDNLTRAMAACERHAPCTLIVQHSDRLARGNGREAKHLVEYMIWAIKTRVTIRSIQDPQTFEDLLRAVLTGERNHEDSARKAAAVKDGLRRRAQKGGLAGGPRSYGYRWVAWLDEQGKRQSELRPVAEEVPVVRRMFAESALGRSGLVIARDLNDDGIVTSQGKRWTQGSVWKVLANPLYVGKIRHDGEIYDGAHEAIVDQKTWDAAARMRGIATKQRTTKTRSKRTGKETLRGAAPGTNNGGGRLPVGHHLLVRGLLKCSCGATMGPRTDCSRRGTQSEVYRCAGRYADVTSCSQAPVERSVIDGPLLAEVTRRYLSLEESRERYEARRDARRQLAASTVDEAEREASAAGESLQRVKADYLSGAITAAEWRELRSELELGQQAAEAAAEMARAQVTSQDTDDAEVAVLEQLAELRASALAGIESAPDLNALRKMLAQLFSEVVYQDGKLYPRVRIPEASTRIVERPIGADMPAPRTIPLVVSDPVGLGLEQKFDLAGLFAPITL